MKRFLSVSAYSVILLSMWMVMGGCSGSGNGGNSGSGSGTTVVSGKVTLSSTILGKAGLLNSLSSLPTAKPGTAAFKEQSSKLTLTGLSNVLLAPVQASALGGARVDFYDADHPEWLYPVASVMTDLNGNYTLHTMTNSAINTGATYRDGDPIPAGKYTLVAHKDIGKPVIAVQSLVKEFSGDLNVVDFEVLPSDASPAVVSMFGVSKNQDGTQTFGGSTTFLPASSAIQITFSIPMVRESLAAIAITANTAGATIPTGYWSLSPDWLTATYYYDQGQKLTKNAVYTITINGADKPGTSQALNVYGNPIDETVTGTFSATDVDTIGPTVQWNSPTVIEMGNSVDVTQAFRIEANEMLDVNTVNLQGSPSIGAKPGVIYLGKAASGMYVYEFELGEPLKLDTRYGLRVSRGKDLSGNTMNELSGSIVTKDAANTPGISLTDSLGNPMTPDAQNFQAQVKSVFGKWVRAMNDRNIAQLQNMMSGNFYMEYDVRPTAQRPNGIDNQWDVNRDGRYSFSEFSAMMQRNSFTNWEYCGSTLTGNVVGSINVVPSINSADFEFTLSATNLVNSESCNQAAPKQHLYATLAYLNGAWRIVRASEGIDNRNKPVTNPNFINSSLSQISFPGVSRSTVTDGQMLSGVPLVLNETDSLSQRPVAVYSWDRTRGVETYVLIIVDGNDPRSGIAYAFSPLTTSVATNQDWDIPLGGMNVSYYFGLNSWNFKYRPGGRYYWEVLGFGTTALPDFSSNSVSQLLKDISATTSIKTFLTPGTYPDLFVQVWPGISTATAPLTFSENFGGYDVGSAYRATLKIRTPNLVSNVSGTVLVEGSSRATYGFTYDGTGAGQVTVVLYRGSNHLTITDSSNPVLTKKINIVTTGGIPPVLGIWDVTDDTGKTLTGDVWNFYTSSGGSSISISGGVTDATVNSLSVSLWSEQGVYKWIPSVPVTVDGAGNHVFTVDLDIYKGNNWVNISGSGSSQWYSATMGVYTDTGTLIMKPITISSVSPGKKMGTYSNSEEWLSSPSGPAYSVVISGAFAQLSNGAYPSGNYWIWGDGKYQTGTITANPDGSFSFPATMYVSDAVNGSWNHVSINTSAGWYGVDILAMTGQAVLKPKITEINGLTYDPVAMNGVFDAGTSCMATISGNAAKGPVNAYWRGYDGSAQHYEQMTVLSNVSNQFNVSMPIVGGKGSYNYFTFYDSNWKSMSVVMTTTCGQAYAVPSTQILTANKSAISPDGSGNYSYDAGSGATVTLTGTTDRPGATITAQLNGCSSTEWYQATASSASAPYTWTISNINVYKPIGTNYIYVGDGVAQHYVAVSSSNAVYPPQPLNATLTGGATQTAWSCGNTTWITGSALTTSISGTTTAPDGTGYYVDPINGRHSFPITGGKFAINDIAVYQGQNYIYLVDTAWNSALFTISSENGVTMPHFVSISSPVSGATITNGTITITGDVQDPTGTGYAPYRVTAQVYDYNDYMSTYYSSDPVDRQNNPTWLPITFSSGTFSFPYTISGGNAVYITVSADDTALNASHGAQIGINTSYQQYYWKPGMSAPVDPGLRKMMYGDYLKQWLSQQ